MANDNDRQAGVRLLQQATAAEFQIVRSEVFEGIDGGEFGLRVELQFVSDDEDGLASDDSGALGFLFAIGVLSFADARPRGASEMHYQEQDEFGVGDFLNCLSHSVGGHLRFDADYVRGRRMKTRIVVSPNGPVVIDTQGRGKSAEHWLARLQGGQRLRSIGE
jgi:hypothetical protein